jgi:hypothetical protein
MATALRSDEVNQRRSARRSAATQSNASTRLEAVPSLRSRRRSTRSSARVSLPTAVNEQVVTALPRTASPPLWLKWLIRVQRVSSVTTFLLVISILTVYGWTVYVQQRWGQEYSKFETLKKQERQLISGNEALKNQMAQQAESPNSGLMVPDPNNTIFLTPAPERPPVQSKPRSAHQTTPTKPLGY